MDSSSSSSSMVGMKEVNDDEEEEERPHVLVVDDSLVDRKIMEKLFTNSACKVTTAESGHKALELLDKHTNINHQGPKINLVVTDYCMPGMTGYDLLKKVKESSDIKEIPVIVVSSENVPTRIEKCLEEGAQEFIIKPLKQSDVKKLRCRMQFPQPIKGRLCLGR